MDAKSQSRLEVHAPSVLPLVRESFLARTQAGIPSCVFKQHKVARPGGPPLLPWGLESDTRDRAPLTAHSPNWLAARPGRASGFCRCPGQRCQVDFLRSRRVAHARRDGGSNANARDADPRSRLFALEKRHAIACLVAPGTFGTTHHPPPRR